MRSLMLSIPVYHVGKKESNNTFQQNPAILVSHEDGEWAGEGLYVWDNMGNANYWLKQKNKIAYNKSSGTEYSIIKLNLKVDEKYILDLTDPYSVKEFERFVEKLKDYGFFGKKKNFENKGALINAYYNTIKSFIKKNKNLALSKYFKDKQFEVTKIIGYYPMIKDTIYFKENDKKQNKKVPHVTIKAKPMYAVRDLELLSIPN